MSFQDLVLAVGGYSCFDLNTLKTLFPADASTMPLRLYRWKKAGRVIELRRGLYTLSAPYRKAPLHGPAVAEAIYHPSYLSLEWALSWYGLVPEKAGIYTSVTTRERRSFRNALGVFHYRTIKPDLFFGHRIERIMDTDVRLAQPEKALIDFWYLNSGEWTVQRMESMRFDPEALADHDRLEEMAASIRRPRLERALGAWKAYAGQFSAIEEIRE